MDNKDLVKRARAGDKDAFAALYINYKDKLYRYAYFKVGSEADAQDAVSACIVSAYTAIATLKSEKAFSAWIFRILYRECCGIITRKSERRLMSELDENEPEVPCSSYLAPELSEALNILSNEEKDIILLSTVAGYNSREISKILNLNSATVRSKLSRGLSKMRKFLE